MADKNKKPAVKEKKIARPSLFKRMSKIKIGGKKTKWALFVVFAILVLMLVVPMFFEKERVTLNTDTGPTAQNVKQILPQAAKARKKEAPGVAFTQTVINLLDHELNRSFGGWRPNNLIIGGVIPLDNVTNYQYGVLDMVRRVMIEFRDHLSRPGGGASELDPNVSKALNLLNIDATSFWFPSADAEYAKAVEELRIYNSRLKNKKAVFFTRSDNLNSMLNAIRAALSAAGRDLTMTQFSDGKQVTMFDTDDIYYHSRGVALACRDIMEAIAVEFEEDINTSNAMGLTQWLISTLNNIDEEGTPWMVVDGEADDVFLANSRRNLATWILMSHAVLVTLMDNLSK